MISGYHKENIRQMNELLAKKELTPADLKAIEALEATITEYEDRYLSNKHLKIVK